MRCVKRIHYRAAFASWLMMNLLLIVVPRYGAYAMIITALFLLLTCFVYHCMLPVTPLIIRFEENKQLTFGFGWCFWLTFFAGKIEMFCANSSFHDIGGGDSLCRFNGLFAYRNRELDSRRRSRNLNTRVTLREAPGLRHECGLHSGMPAKNTCPHNCPREEKRPCPHTFSFSYGFA